MVKGKIASKTTSLVNFNGGWYYIVKGKLAAKTTTLVKRGDVWYYVNKGKVDFTANTLVKYNGAWYYVNNGRMDNQSSAMVEYQGRYYLVAQGQVGLNPGDAEYFTQTSYTYNSLGRLVSDDNGYRTNLYYYDAQGRLSRMDYRIEIDGIEKIRTENVYTYFADGSRMVEIFYDAGGGYELYDSNGKITYSEINSGGLLEVNTYFYDEFGYLSFMTIEENGEVLDGYEYYYQYNHRNQPICCDLWQYRTPLSTTYYRYDAKGKLVQEIELHETYKRYAEVTDYTYNNAGQLITESWYWVNF